jgi:HTH-type transcriptional regulator/antitoxin HigA
MTKATGKMTPIFNNTIYRNLLSEVAPKLIESEAEYERALKILEELTFKQNCTPEERTLSQLLVTLIEIYESENYPIQESKPHEILQHIRESSGINEDDLGRIIGVSDGIADILNGKRALNKTQAQALGDYFQLSPSLFVDDFLTN